MTDRSTDFSIKKNIYYLNHAAVSPWPVKTSEAIKVFADENTHFGASHYPKWLTIEQNLKQNITQLINAPSCDDIALVKNTSEALSMVAYGLSWNPGDNIVIAQQEFPSNRIVWQSLQSQGVEVKFVDLYHNTNNSDSINTPEDNLTAAVDENTRLLSVSSVQYGDGLRINLKKLGQFCQEKQILYCVDAIQSIGALNFDVQAIQADFAMADGHKWLMSPEGLGLFYCRSELRKKMKLTQYGWRMTENLFDFETPFWKEASSARKFECGSPNMLGIHALNSSILLILERKIDFIEKMVINNSKSIMNKLASIPKITVISDVNRDRISGIVSFRHESIPSEQLYQELMELNVICAMRQGNVRFSPHYYTSEAVIEGAIKILKNIILA
jgi:cysteine desulfurase / selenocysteine lyase